MWIKLPLDMWAGRGEGFLIKLFSAPGGKTLIADIPAIVLAGKFGPAGLSNDEQR